MAKFTSSAQLNIRWHDVWEFSGPAGTQFTIADDLYDEFNGEMSGLIPDLTWVTTADIPTLPITEADVTSLTADLAGKASSVHTHAESSITSLTTDLGNKYDKTGGTISGAVTVTGALVAQSTLSAVGLTTLGAVSAGAVTASSTKVTGQSQVNGGFTNSYDTDLYVAGANRASPANLAQSIYSQLRVSGDMGSQVMDGIASEIRLNGISNATFLNSIEASVVITGGSNAIPDARAVTANLSFSGTPTGTITAAKLIVAQAIANATSVAITTVYGVYVENQTVGATNWSVYAPTGTSHFGVLETEGDLTVGDGTTTRNIIVNGSSSQVRDIRFESNGSLRWIWRIDSTAETGSNAGSNLTLLARTDAGGSLATVLTITRSSGAFGIGNVPVGFFGTTPASKQTVTGSRGSNAALTSLLTALATYGIITNSTSA